MKLSFGLFLAIICFSNTGFSITNATLGKGGKSFCEDIKSSSFKAFYARYCLSERYWTGSEVCSDLDLIGSFASDDAYFEYCDRSVKPTRLTLLWGT